MLTVEVITKAGARREYRFLGPGHTQITVGSSEGADIRLPAEEGVPSLHTLFFFEAYDERWRLFVKSGMRGIVEQQEQRIPFNENVGIPLFDDARAEINLTPVGQPGNIQIVFRFEEYSPGMSGVLYKARPSLPWSHPLPLLMLFSMIALLLGYYLFILLLLER